METMTYWWLKVSTWYYTNVGSDYHGYQVFNWWIVDDRTHVPLRSERELGCTEVFCVGPYHFLKKD